MIVNSRNADAIRRSTMSEAICDFGLRDVTEFTLAGIMEMIATAVASASGSRLLREIENVASTKDGALRLAWQRWNSTNHNELGSDIHGAPPVEFFRFRTREDQTGLPYQLYQERFVRSMKRAEFPVKFAEALAGALVEMTDNIIQHSRSVPGEYSGLAGFHVSSGYMSFSVMDVGQGILASLLHSSNWSHLKSAQDALRAAVCSQASSRPDQPIGEGFRTVFRSLTDRNCCLRFRSHDAMLRIEDAGAYRDGAVFSSPPLAGLQLTVCCALKGRAEEVVIKSD